MNNPAVPLLELRDVNTHYGAVHILKDVDRSIVGVYATKLKQRHSRLIHDRTSPSVCSDPTGLPK